MADNTLSESLGTVPQLAVSGQTQTHRLQRLAWPVILFLVWRLSFELISLWAASLPHTLHIPTTPYQPPDLDFWADRLQGVWSHWDGEWFLYISQTGYLPGDFSTPYFPLYPILLRVTSVLTLGNYLLAAALLNNLFALLVFGLLYELIRHTYRHRVAVRSLVMLAVFPASFFLIATYSESLFLALALGAFLAARKYSNWAVVGLLVGLAAVTRNIGILLLVPLGWEWLSQNHQNLLEKTGQSWRLRLRWTALPLLPTAFLVIIPVVTYTSWLVFQWINFANPFSFVSAVSQPAWQRHSAWPWQTLATVVAIFRGEPYPRLPDSFNFECGVVAVVLPVFVLACYQTRRKQMPVSFLLFFGIALLVPLSAPNLDDPLLSFPRYIMVAFPMYLSLALCRPIVRLGYGLLAGGVLCYQVALFVNWYWVG